MRRALPFLAALLAALTPPASSQPAAAPAPAPLATPAPIHAGSLTAYRYGSGSRTLVLLPGIGCGAWVWDSTVAALRSKYTIYAVTFPGFDGLAPVKPPYMAAFADGVAQLLRQEKVQRPVLVGHGMGGDVALSVAIADPGSVGGIVAVDTLPINPPLQPGETLASRGSPAPALPGLLNGSQDDYEESTREATAMKVTNPATAAGIAARSLRSDRATVSGVASELAATNLGAGLPRITAPILVLAASSAYSPDQTAEFYRAQYANAKSVTVRAIPNSRHFIMYDQGAEFLSALSAFVDGLP
jgi:pimeloyl-ACP methyl ester carboxylesterase